jgi:EAL domain-containing protein (putative c-di-GMP-specific phosphodiesterase class I)
MRSQEPALPHPGAVLTAAEQLGRMQEVGRTVRRLTVAAIAGAPAEVQLFLNLHPSDLLDEDLYSTEHPLTAHAARIFLEITERASLDAVPQAAERVKRLRSLGYRIALDDLGAGYAGLTSFATLEPEVVKLDMSLIRGIDGHAIKQKLVRSMVTTCREVGAAVVAEGIETEPELATVIGLGCDFLQGYFLGKPGPGFPKPAWPPA